MALETRPPKILRFATFEVDVRAGELRKQGKRIKLQDQPFQVLIVLLQRPGNVVTREELRSQIWPKDTFVDFDNSLNTAINKLREALGDFADNPRFVETLPRRGYRFIAPVNGFQAGGGTEDLGKAVEARWRLRPLGWTVGIISFAVLAATLFSLNVFRVRDRLLSARTGSQMQSLAVLPLTNLSGDPAQEYLADGMTDALITELGKIGSLRVISRTSAMHYKQRNDKTLPEIAKELNVDGVVEGSVIRSGNRVRITAQLTQARQDRQVWAHAYERDLGDVLKLQDEVVQAIAEQVRIHLTTQQRVRLGSAPRVNPEAYDAYLQGRFYLWTTSTEQGTRKALAYFEEALQKDSSFAPAYVGRADCYLNLGSLRYLSPADASDHAKQAIHQALELDESLAEAHTALGRLSWLNDWDWRTAEREFRYALELNPNSMEGHFALLLYLAWNGKRAEALTEDARIHELDPVYPFGNITRSLIYYQLREYKALTEVSQKSAVVNPEAWVAHYFLAVSYEGLGRYQEAIQEYRKAVELSEGDSDPTAGLGHAYAIVGRTGEAEEMLHELQEQSKTSYVSPYMIATIYAGLGNKDKAFEFLEKAYQDRSWDLPYFLKADLRIDTLRSDRRFHELERRVGLPQ